jgi:hypothetical protein
MAAVVCKEAEIPTGRLGKGLPISLYLKQLAIDCPWGVFISPTKNRKYVTFWLTTK